jgi:hypothetical protein
MRRTIFILLLLAAGCSSVPADTGIEGQVLIGPMCPVVQQGRECPDQPYQAVLIIQTSAGRRVTKITTNAKGKFRLPLAPGTYLLHPQNPQNSPMPFATDQTFTVVKSHFTQITLVFDSGIR